MQLALRHLTFNLFLQLVAVAGGLIGNSYINHADATGFLLWIVSNIALIWLQIRLRMWALVGLYGAYLYLCFDGISRWHHSAPESLPAWLPDWLLALAHFIT